MPGMSIPDCVEVDWAKAPMLRDVYDAMLKNGRVARVKVGGEGTWRRGPRGVMEVL